MSKDTPLKSSISQTNQQVQQQQTSHRTTMIFERIKEFTEQLNELKSNAAKLFDGKELTTNLLDYSVIKNSKQIRVKYEKINEEIQSLNDKCVNLREVMLTDFCNFEKLRLLKYNITNPKTASSFVKQFELDPITREKYENVKKLYAYISRELPNIKSYLEIQKKKKQEQSITFVSYDEVYESIKTIEILVNQNNKQIGKFIEKIKLLKMDNNHLIRDLNLLKFKEKLGEEEKKDEQVQQRDYSAFLEDSLELKSNESNKTKRQADCMAEDLNTSDLDKRVSRLELKRGSGERDAQFFSQLYELLRKRKQTPQQKVSLSRLDLYDERFDRIDNDATRVWHEQATPTTPIVSSAAATKVAAATSGSFESSFLKLNSPNVSIVPHQLITTLAAPTPNIQISMVQQQQPQPQLLAQNPSVKVPIQAPIIDSSTPSSTPQKPKLLPQNHSPAPQQSTPPQVSLFNLQNQGVQQQQIIKPQQPKQSQQQPLAALHSMFGAVTTISKTIPVATTVAPQTSNAKPNIALTTATPTVQLNPATPTVSQAQPVSSSGIFSFNLQQSTTTTFASAPLFNLSDGVLTKPVNSQTSSSLQPVISSENQLPKVPSTSSVQQQQQSTAAVPTSDKSKSVNATIGLTPTLALDESSKQIMAAKITSESAKEPTKEAASTSACVKKEQTVKTDEIKTVKTHSQVAAERVEQPRVSEADANTDAKTIQEKASVIGTGAATAIETKVTDEKNLEKVEVKSIITEKIADQQATPMLALDESGKQIMATKITSESEKETAAVGLTAGSTTGSSTAVTTPSFFGAAQSNTTITPTPAVQPLFNLAKPVDASTTPAPFLSQVTTPTANLFTDMANQKTNGSNEIDADMDSSTNNLTSGLSFGGPGSSKPLNSSVNEPPKNFFTYSFKGSGVASAGQQSAAKSTFTFGSTTNASSIPTSPSSTGGTSGGILKTATFTATSVVSLPQSGGIFGSSTGGGGASGLFSQSSSGTGGGLFSSFKSPEKETATIFSTGSVGSSVFGAPPTFGGAPAFSAGATSAFGASSSGLFGSTAASQPLFGNTGASFESKSLFGSMSQNQSSGFSSLAKNESSFRTFGQNSTTSQVGFGTLAQQQPQQPQQSLFSSFNQPTNTGFTSPTSSSFTTYRK